MLSQWNFDNSYLELPKIFFSKTKPNEFSNLELILKNHKLIDKLSLDKTEFDKFIVTSIDDHKKDFYSQAYAGHQFGHFTILGDGRATLLGEHINRENKRFDIQLKGSGKTPYSRNGDGKGTLKSMLREYIVSEAMHNLNIKTTRSLAVLKTGEKIIRNGFEEGGILVRVAKSHIRVGTFQLAALSNENGNIEALVNYSIKRLHPEIYDHKDRYLEFYKKIVENQINLVIEWQRVGFIHGVMNTDNMALSGETIDYGPCAFLDEYNPKKVFSSIDQNGRYSFNNQPKIALWNLARFAETILHLIDKDQSLAIKKIQDVLKSFEKKYHESWLEMMKNKLQINNHSENDVKLITELLDLMHVFKLDFTNTFIEIDNDEISKYDFMKNWISKLEDRKKINKKFDKIKYKYNPRIIPRNHLVEKVLNESENCNYSLLIKFIENLNDPYSNDISSDFQKGPTEDEKVHQTFCGT